MEKRPDIVSIVVFANKNKVLKDHRLGKDFALFGNILDVAKQYGIEYEEIDSGIVFKAPKSRMQIFVEKLHFAKVEYRIA